MTESILAAEEGGPAIHVGHHTLVFEMFGMTFNGDTILATAITAVIVIGLAFYLKSKVTSTGVPSIPRIWLITSCSDWVPTSIPFTATMTSPGMMPAS